MAKNLVIVESPAKAKTIKKYLGKGFEVMASYGHVRDLLPKANAVDTEHDFAMKYQIIEKSEKHVDAITRAVKKADCLFLATDPDREGEAISWHLYELLKERNVLKDKNVNRVVFHEITKRAIVEAIEHPRDLSMELINAQQARRVLDFLVGFNLSPLLWKKVRRGLSAGRVQSAALRLIVEREIEIEQFKPQEYWTILAQVSKDEQAFTAKLYEYHQEKVKQFSFTDDKTALGIRDELAKIAKGKLAVTKVEKKKRKRNPAAPFTTSTLQQEAVRKLGFTAKKTMTIAQQLYEGIEIGEEGGVGLITYMRTDSVNLAADAVAEIRDFIEQRYGKNNVPPEARVFKTKSKNAQEAHEAVRPTSVLRTPEDMKPFLDASQFRLYELVWKRTVACQMSHATINTMAVDLGCGEGNVFRATGSSIADPGFMLVYQESSDAKKEDDEKMLPALEEGDVVDLQEIQANQHFTEPPPRFTEASLVKTLEEHGIGRPSTYASIISTLQNREYVSLEKRHFIPADVGRVVNKFLTEHFTQYVDYGFTARMEDELDAVARGEEAWIPLLHRFWKPFKDLVVEKEESVSRKDVTQEAMDENCPKCNAPLSIRLGKHGRFVGCTAYPDCDYTRNVDGSDSNEAEKIEGRKCPDCNSDLVIKVGRYGKFIGCSSYPDCRFIEPLNKPKDTGVPCPECKEGNILTRRARSGKIFYSCSRYPDCTYALWNEPVNEACPSCGWPILSLKVTKRHGTEKVCPQKGCDYKVSIPNAEGM